MSKFCNNCGNMVDDSAMFCNNCGATFQEEAAYAPQEAPVEAPVPAKKTLSKKMIGIIAGAAVAVVAVVLILVFALGGKSQFAGLAGNLQQMVNGDFKNIEKMCPEAYWEYCEDEYKDFDREDLVKNSEKEFKDQKKEYKKEYGDDWKATVEVFDEKKMDKDMIADAAEYLSDTYDFDEKSITDGYTVWFRMDIKGSDGRDHNISEMNVLKIDGKWYLCNVYEIESENGKEEVRVSFMN